MHLQMTMSTCQPRLRLAIRYKVNQPQRLVVRVYLRAQASKGAICRCFKEIIHSRLESLSLWRRMPATLHASILRKRLTYLQSCPTRNVNQSRLLCSQCACACVEVWEEGLRQVHDVARNVTSCPPPCGETGRSWAQIPPAPLLMCIVHVHICHTLLTYIYIYVCHEVPCGGSRH